MTGLSGCLLINPRAGDAQPSAEELARAAAALAIETRILQPGEDAAEAARRSSAEVLGIAGGDGSLAPVADVAVTLGKPFVCVPFGTRNHFARDLGLDVADPLAALAAFSGDERRVDVGRAGERLFLNNVSLGLYARLVHRRESRRKRRAVLARARALALLARHRGSLGLVIDGSPVDARVVLVASNAYRLDLFSIGERDSLDTGRLHLYVAEGWLPRSWAERSGERFTIDAPARQLSAAVDGEPDELPAPVEFTIAPRALRVLVPRTPR